MPIEINNINTVDDALHDLSALTVSHVFEVDNGRTDDYVPNGSKDFPYKTIQDAYDAIPDGTSASNIYIIRAKLGLPYTGDITISKDFITVVGDGGITGAGYTGNVISTSKHLTLKSINITDGSTFTQIGVGDFLLEFKDCHMGGVLTVTATGTTDQKENSYLQVTGDDNLWMGMTINITGILGFAGMTGGAYVGNTVTITDSYFCPGCSCVDSNVTNLEAGSITELFSMYAVRNTINLKSGATLYTDITAMADMDNILNVSAGSTLYCCSDKPILGAFERIASAAKGDLFYLNASGTLTRLPVGTSGQTLKVSSAGIPEWGAAQTSDTLSLTVEGWSESSQTITATGVTATNIAIVAPTPEDTDNYTDAGIRCTAQGTDELTFTCESTPAEAISVNVVIL
jgi:hypothetical protein